MSVARMLLKLSTFGRVKESQSFIPSHRACPRRCLRFSLPLGAAEGKVRRGWAFKVICLRGCVTRSRRGHTGEEEGGKGGNREARYGGCNWPSDLNSSLAVLGSLRSSLGVSLLSQTWPASLVSWIVMGFVSLSDLDLASLSLLNSDLAL